MCPTQHLLAYHRFDELVATYLAFFPDAVDADAAEDADIAQMSTDMARGLARGTPIPYLLPPPLDSMAAHRRALSRHGKPPY